MLIAYLIYSDGIGTITRMAATYGTELGIPQSSLITQFCWSSSSAFHSRSRSVCLPAASEQRRRFFWG
jgi:MFS-type transporter involved in bile tolerance (Atg22 family)